MPQNTYPYNTPRAPVSTTVQATIPNTPLQNQPRPNNNTQPQRANQSHYEPLLYSYKERFDKFFEAQLVAPIFSKPYKGNYPSWYDPICTVSIMQ